jgi:hypothetical protein
MLQKFVPPTPTPSLRPVLKKKPATAMAVTMMIVVTIVMYKETKVAKNQSQILTLIAKTSLRKS